MELITPEILQTLGGSSIFAVFLLIAWRKINDDQGRYENNVEKKDARIAALTDELMEKYSQNTMVMEKAISIMERNEKLTERVLERMEGVISPRERSLR